MARLDQRVPSMLARSKCYRSSQIRSARSRAAVPGLDPLGLSERGRTLYVYLGELLLLGLLLHVRLNVPDGAFYAFFDVSAYFGKPIGGRTVRDSLGFCTACLEAAHVNLVPGSAFGCEGFVRMSYAASREQLTGGLDRLESWLAGRP